MLLIYIVISQMVESVATNQTNHSCAIPGPVIYVLAFMYQLAQLCDN